MYWTVAYNNKFTLHVRIGCACHKNPIQWKQRYRTYADRLIDRAIQFYPLCVCSRAVLCCFGGVKRFNMEYNSSCFGLFSFLWDIKICCCFVQGSSTAFIQMRHIATLGSCHQIIWKRIESIHRGAEGGGRAREKLICTKSDGHRLAERTVFRCSRLN